MTIIKLAQDTALNASMYQKVEAFSDDLVYLLHLTHLPKWAQPTSANNVGPLDVNNC